MYLFIFACVLFTGFAFGDIEDHPLSDAFIRKINEAQGSWKAGRNFDENTPLETMKSLLGVKPGYKTKLRQKVTEDVKDLPDNFDARERWSDCKSIKQIRDQSTCGSCWAIAAVEVMSDRICINSNASVQVSLSPNSVVSCCWYCGAGCDGGLPDQAWTWWIETGCVSGGEYGDKDAGCQSYFFPSCNHLSAGLRPACGPTQTTPMCTKECDPGSNFTYDEDLHFGEDAYRIEKIEKSIRSEIFENGPVQASITVYEDFFNYKSGVYKHKVGKIVGYHSLKIIGWGIEEKSPYWLVANSWNEDWGDKGFIKILRGTHECGIEDEILGGIPKLN